MPWKTAAGRYIGKRREDRIGETWTGAANEALAHGAPHGFAFKMADMAVGDMLERERTGVPKADDNKRDNT